MLFDQLFVLVNKKKKKIQMKIYNKNKLIIIKVPYNLLVLKLHIKLQLKVFNPERKVFKSEKQPRKYHNWINKE